MKTDGVRAPTEGPQTLEDGQRAIVDAGVPVMERIRRIRGAKRVQRGLGVDEDGSGALYGGRGEAPELPSSATSSSTPGPSTSGFIGKLAVAARPGDHDAEGRGHGGGEFTTSSAAPAGNKATAAETAVEAERRKFVDEQLRKKGLLNDASAARGPKRIAVTDAEELENEEPVQMLPLRPDFDMYELPESIRKAMAQGKAEGVTKPISAADAARLGVDLATVEAAKARMKKAMLAAAEGVAAGPRRGATGGGAVAGTSEDDPTQGGVLAWNTGLAEVRLPAEARLENVRATEAAKRAYLERAAVRAVERATKEAEGDEASLTAFAAPSFNASYTQHRRAYGATQRAKSLKSTLYALSEQHERAIAMGEAGEAARLKAELGRVKRDLARASDRNGMSLAMDSTGATAALAEASRAAAMSLADPAAVADDSIKHPAEQARGGPGFSSRRTRATDDDLARRYRRSIVRRL